MLKHNSFLILHTYCRGKLWNRQRELWKGQLCTPAPPTASPYIFPGVILSRQVSPSQDMCSVVNGGSLLKTEGSWGRVLIALNLGGL